MKLNKSESEKLIHFDTQYKIKEEALFIEYRFVACICYLLASILQAFSFTFAIKQPVLLFFLIGFFLLGLKLDFYHYMNYKTSTATIPIYELMEHYCISQKTILLQRISLLMKRGVVLFFIEAGIQIVFRLVQGNVGIDMLIYPLIIQVIVFILTSLQFLPWNNLFCK